MAEFLALITLFCTDYFSLKLVHSHFLTMTSILCLEKCDPPKTGLAYIVPSLSALGFYVLKGLSCGILHFQNNSSLCNHLDKKSISLTPNKLPPSHCTRHQISSRNLDKFFKILSCLVHFQHSRLKKMHLRGELRCHHTVIHAISKAFG